jgi:lysophospholipase L1-like esterase
VFVGTVPHVTIPPVTRGVSPGKPPQNRLVGNYYEFYTRPWIWDDVFDKDKHPHLTREQAKKIDKFIDQYNETIEEVADANGWHVFDASDLLDDLAFRRGKGGPPYKFPDGLMKELKKLESLENRFGKDEDQDPERPLDTRFFRVYSGDPKQIERGGLISLDGIHPTTIGYSLVADLLVKTMSDAGVNFGKEEGTDLLDWEKIVQMDTLVNRPPALLSDLKSCLEFLDKRALLSSILDLF